MDCPKQPHLTASGVSACRRRAVQRGGRSSASLQGLAAALAAGLQQAGERSGVGTAGGGSSGRSPSWAAPAASQAEAWAVSCNLHGRLGAMGHAASREPCNPTLLLSCALHAAAAGATRRVTVSRAPRCCWAAPASTRPPQRSASILPALASSCPRCPRNGGTLGSQAGHALPKMGGG